MPRSCPRYFGVQVRSEGARDVELLHDLKHVFEALVSRIAGVIL
jgi:hypothetical protein